MSCTIPLALKTLKFNLCLTDSFDSNSEKTYSAAPAKISVLIARPTASIKISVFVSTAEVQLLSSNGFKSGAHGVL